MEKENIVVQLELLLSLQRVKSLIGGGKINECERIKKESSRSTIRLSHKMLCGRHLEKKIAPIFYKRPIYLSGSWRCGNW